jgi:uncharacterized membrane protein (DUF373 family)
MYRVLRTFLGNSLYETFEHVIMLVLTLLLTVLIANATWELVKRVVVVLLAGQVNPTDPSSLSSVFVMFFTVLIGLEFKRSFLIVSTTQESVVRVRSIILIGMLATVRKFIVLDLKAVDVMEMLVVSAAILALGIVYWLVKDRDPPMKQATNAAPATMPAEGQVIDRK